MLVSIYTGHWRFQRSETSGVLEQAIASWFVVYTVVRLYQNSFSQPSSTSSSDPLNQALLALVGTKTEQKQIPSYIADQLAQSSGFPIWHHEVSRLAREAYETLCELQLVASTEQSDGFLQHDPIHLTKLVIDNMQLKGTLASSSEEGDYDHYNNGKDGLQQPTCFNELLRC